MEFAAPLRSDQLSWQCPVSDLAFQDTSELSELDEIIGQERALEAISFGIGMRHEGYNLFVLGPTGTGKRTIVKRFLERQARHDTTPSDWCYVQNFEEADKPKSLQLPAGRGITLKGDMEALVEDLLNAVESALESEGHQSQIEQLEQEGKQEHEQALAQFAEKARERGIQLVRTPGGFALAPIKGEEILPPEEFEQLPDEERLRIEEDIASLQNELKEIVEQLPRLRRDVRERIKELNRGATSLAVKHLIQNLTARYQDLPQVVEYLNAVERDVIENADDFKPQEEPSLVFGVSSSSEQAFQRYRVNLLVDNSQVDGAPVVYEEHPSYQNLLGRVEHITHLGTLATDFTLIKPGSLHRANGGYLILEARRVLQQPYAWEALKRALFAKHLKIESLAEALSLVSTVSLEPDPIPSEVKVVLLGDRSLYYALYEYDPDFAELFKVAADFHDDFDRTPETCRLYARMIATLVSRHGLKPFDASAVGRVIEHASRMTSDAQKVTARIRALADLLREADYWATQAARATVTTEDVVRAIERHDYRVDRIRGLVQEQIQRDLMLVDTSGARIGQINGLAVAEQGGFRFGRPTRITATTRLGNGHVIDIEREVELGGAIHSKGVLILSSYLGAKFAKKHPLSLHASLVFEQSYGAVEGDSASVAELVTLCSSLAEIPIRQSLAVTGSVNQHGQVQPVGGINEKIEGFFDICQARGLTGDQGVVIPRQNVQHLMLRSDVVVAAERGEFQIYAVDTIDNALALLTGKSAGEADYEGQFPEDSVNGRVAARLREFADLQRAAAKDTGTEKFDG